MRALTLLTVLLLTCPSFAEVCQDEQLKLKTAREFVNTRYNAAEDVKVLEKMNIRGSGVSHYISFTALNEINERVPFAGQLTWFGKEEPCTPWTFYIKELYPFNFSKCHIDNDYGAVVGSCRSWWVTSCLILADMQIQENYPNINDIYVQASMDRAGFTGMYARFKNNGQEHLYHFRFLEGLKNADNKNICSLKTSKIIKL